MNQTEEKVILVFLNNICKNNAKKGVFNSLISFYSVLTQFSVTFNFSSFLFNHNNTAI